MTYNPAPTASRRNPHPLSWLLPVVAVTAVSTALAAAYLGGSLNASDNIKDFPIAIVNEDTGATLPNGQPLTIGDQIETGLTESIDADQFDIHQLTLADAETQLRDGTLYGALVLPETLSTDVLSFAQGALAPGEGTAPSVEVLTNPRMGLSATNIVTTLGDTAFTTANADLGNQVLTLTEQMATALGVTTPLPGTTAQALADPLNIQVTAFNPLPDGTGGGLSAFYYALILILAGFSGSIIANAFIDSRLGFLPLEIGPRYHMAPASGYSRRRTLIAKWAVMAAIAVLVSAAYIAISSALGMPIDHPGQLFLFGALAITGIAIVAQTINALLGNLGLMVNLFIMIILAIPSSGGTVPIEATPGFFRWLATFEPMHQIYAGTRSILYLDATWHTGLGQGIIASTIAIVAGLVIGLIGTSIYDSRKLTRSTTTPQQTSRS